MASVNKALILGNLGQDPELRYTKQNKPVATMSIATRENYTDASGEARESTEWHRVVVFGKQAEFCAEYLRKGSAAHVEGRIKTRSYEDKNGQTKYSTEIIADRVQFLSKSNESGQSFKSSSNDSVQFPRNEGPKPKPRTGPSSFDHIEF